MDLYKEMYNNIKVGLCIFVLAIRLGSSVGLI